MIGLHEFFSSLSKQQLRECCKVLLERPSGCLNFRTLAREVERVGTNHFFNSCSLCLIQQFCAHLRLPSKDDKAHQISDLTGSSPRKTSKTIRFSYSQFLKYVLLSFLKLTSRSLADEIFLVGMKSLFTSLSLEVLESIGQSHGLMFNTTQSKLRTVEELLVSFFNLEPLSEYDLRKHEQLLERSQRKLSKTCWQVLPPPSTVRVLSAPIKSQQPTKIRKVPPSAKRRPPRQQRAPVNASAHHSATVSERLDSGPSFSTETSTSTLATEPEQTEEKFGDLESVKQKRPPLRRQSCRHERPRKMSQQNHPPSRLASEIGEQNQVKLTESTVHEKNLPIANNSISQGAHQTVPAANNTPAVQPPSRAKRALTSIRGNSSRAVGEELSKKSNDSSTTKRRKVATKRTPAIAPMRRKKGRTPQIQLKQSTDQMKTRGKRVHIPPSFSCITPKSTFADLHNNYNLTHLVAYCKLNGMPHKGKKSAVIKRILASFQYVE